MKTQKLIVLIMVLVMGFAMAGCQKETPAKDVYEGSTGLDLQAIGHYPVTVTDKYGVQTVLEQAPEKVVSFSPEFVEIMYALGVGDKLIGRSIYCDYPEEANNIPDMGDLFTLNVETILESGADLVLLSSMASEEQIASIRDQGIDVIALDADTTIEGTYAYIAALGDIFNVKEEAAQLIADMTNEIEAIATKVKDLDKPTAYFAVAVGDYTSAATGDTFINNLMEKAGATNVAADGANWMYTVEQLVEKNPDIVICSKNYDTKNQIYTLDGYKDLKAVAENKVYEVDENIFYRQGPRIVEAVKTLAEIFHPEAFQ